MFVGHLAVALAAKPAAPRVSLGVLTGAAFGLDLLWPILVLAGVERVQIQPGATAFTPLYFESYPWSHSLVMALVWGALVALIVRPRSKTAGLVVAGTVVSHWVLDAVTHAPDLPIWPGGPKVGLGLWNSVSGTLVVEGVLFALAVGSYLRFTAARRAAGRWALWSLLALCVVIWVSVPFAPPPPNATAIASVGLATWLLPFWAHWIDRARAIRVRLSS